MKFLLMIAVILAVHATVEADIPPKICPICELRLDPDNHFQPAKCDDISKCPERYIYRDPCKCQCPVCKCTPHLEC